MWGLWNNSDSNRTESTKAVRQSKDCIETASSITPTRYTTNNCNFNTFSNGAIIGDKHELSELKTEKEKLLHFEYVRKSRETLNMLLSIVEDFNIAQEDENFFKIFGSCSKDSLNHVNLGLMGDAQCSRFDCNTNSSSKSDDSLSIYVAKCSFGNLLTPKQIFDFLVNVENKTLYDSTCAESTIINNLGRLVLVKQCYRGMMGVQGREFLIIGTNFKLSDDCYALVACSVSDSKDLSDNDEDIPVTESYVRGEIKFVGFLIRKMKDETELFFAQKMDLGGAVPIMLQRIVLATQLQSLNSLKKHLLENIDLYFSKEEVDDKNQLKE